MLRTSASKLLGQASTLNRSNRLFSSAAIALVCNKIGVVPDSF